MLSSTKEAAILGVISFLILVLLYSSFSRSNMVFGYRCENNGDTHVKCCQTNPDGKTAWCTVCDKTDPPSNCTPRFCEPIGSSCPESSTNAVLPPPPQPPKNALPPSSTPTPPPASTLGPPPSTSSNEQPPATTPTCPDGSQPDANGNCPSGTTTTNNQQ